MTVHDLFEAQGNRLFRRRSFFPLLLIPFLIVAFQYYSYPLGSYETDLIWEALCLSASIVGLGIRAFTGGFIPGKTSGRTTRKGQRPTR